VLLGAGMLEDDTGSAEQIRLVIGIVHEPAQLLGNAWISRNPVACGS
jgi:hypothetical protein